MIKDRVGVISFLDSQWAYNKHGCGIRFERDTDGLIVDNDRHFDKPYLFDCWRIEQYAELKGEILFNRQDIKNFFDLFLEKVIVKLEKDRSLYYLAER